MQWEGRGHEQTARTNTQVWIVAAARFMPVEMGQLYPYCMRGLTMTRP